MGTALNQVCQSVGISCDQPSHTEVDVTDPDAIIGAIRLFTPDVVVNSVAMIGYDICENDPALAFGVNSLPASAMAKACADRDATFVQISTHAVFDGMATAPYSEEDVPNPLNCYAVTKYMAELFCRNLCKRHYVIRLPTLFGPRRNSRPGFVDKVLSRAVKGEKLRIAVDKIDSPTYSLDAARALVGMLQDCRPSGVYHLTNHGSVSYFDFVATMMRYIASSVEITAVNDGDFPFQGRKPLGTSMLSVRLPQMRSWQDALQEYLGSEGYN